MSFPVIDGPLYMESGLGLPGLTEARQDRLPVVVDRLFHLAFWVDRLFLTAGSRSNPLILSAVRLRYLPASIFFIVTVHPATHRLRVTFYFTPTT